MMEKGTLIANIFIFDDAKYLYCYSCTRVHEKGLVHWYPEWVFCPVCGKPTADGHGHEIA